MWSVYCNMERTFIIGLFVTIIALMTIVSLFTGDDYWYIYISVLIVLVIACVNPCSVPEEERKTPDSDIEEGEWSGSDTDETAEGIVA